MTKAQARYWYMHGCASNHSMTFDDIWDLFQEATKVEPSEILESGTGDLPREATQPPSKPSQPDEVSEVSEDGGGAEDGLGEAVECGGRVTWNTTDQRRECLACGACYLSPASTSYRCTARR